jgi:nucleotide-binding universal stress UspA family protein
VVRLDRKPLWTGRPHVSGLGSSRSTFRQGLIVARRGPSAPRRNIRAVPDKARGAAAPPFPYTGGVKTILAPIDLSPASAGVVRHAAHLARALQARVLLLTVMVPPVFLKEYAPLQETVARVAVGNEQVVRRNLAAIENRLERQSVRCQSILLQGGAARLILEQARKSAAAYIVMGSHGHTAFYDLIVGGTTHAVLKGARCPVIIVPRSPSNRRKAGR